MLRQVKSAVFPFITLTLIAGTALLFRLGIAEMKARLAREAWVSNRGIWIAAKNGVRTLFGMIDTEEEKTGLGVMAQTIAGCKGVENNLFPKSLLPRHGHWL